MTTMKAAVIHEAGGPEVLKIESLPIPTPQSGEVLIRVKAFGLNRSELFTRQGHSPSVKFPRVLGIEAVGVVESAPGSEFRKGDIVATAMGGIRGHREALVFGHLQPRSQVNERRSDAGSLRTCLLSAATTALCLCWAL